MSQAQQTFEPSSNFTTEQNTALRYLTIMGYLEGTSFLLLLGIAMPLKYLFDIPEGVRYIGMAHGGLFIAYIVLLMSVAAKIKMPIWAIPAGVLGSFLPCGPFIFDYCLHKSLKTRKAAV